MQESGGNAFVRGIKAFTDAFAFPLKASHYIELVNPLWADHANQARVVALYDETGSARTIVMKPGGNWRSFKPGQHLRVGVSIGGRQFTRTYSISSAADPSADTFSITVKAIDGGLVSNHIVRKLRVGDYIPVGIAQGDFYLPDAQPVRPLFITAGSGITPIMSMLRTLEQEDRMPDVRHIHYAPHKFDVIFGKELERLWRKYPRYQLQCMYTREPGENVDSMSTQRHFSPDQLEHLCPDWRDRDVFACGPQSLLDSLEAFWASQNLSHQLHTERFKAALAVAATSGQSGEVVFSRSNKTIQSDGCVNLLKTAEDQGLNPEHGCRMGICHACNVKLLAGTVRDLRTNEELNEPGVEIQICVCASVGNVVIDA